MIRKLLYALVALAVAATLIWATDQVTLQGERTIYTVDCLNGRWDGMRCTGRLAAGQRHRFRASRTRQEVVYWIAGSTEPSGKHTGCQVKDRGNWSCEVVTGQPATIAYEMVDNRPTRKGSGLTVAFHAVPKWQWWALQAGLPLFHEAAF